MGQDKNRLSHLIKYFPHLLLVSKGCFYDDFKCKFISDVLGDISMENLDTHLEMGGE